MLFDTDYNTQALIIWGITIALIFIVMVVGLYRNVKVLRERHKDQAARVNKLLLSDMLKRLNIGVKNYFAMTTDIDKERHIQACQNCAKPEECERMLLGEAINPHTFCPNASDLERLQERDKETELKETVDLGRIRAS